MKIGVRNALSVSCSDDTDAGRVRRRGWGHGHHRRLRGGCHHLHICGRRRGPTATVKQNTTTTAAGTTTTAATEEGAEDVGIEDIPVELDLTEEEGAALFLEVAEGRHPEPLVISRPSWR